MICLFDDDNALSDITLFFFMLIAINVNVNRCPPMPLLSYLNVAGGLRLDDKIRICRETIDWAVQENRNYLRSVY